MNARSAKVVAVLVGLLALPASAFSQTVSFPNPVTAVSFSREDKTIACGSGQAVYLLDTATRIVRRKIALVGTPGAIAFSRGSTILFVALSHGNKGAVDYFSALTGKRLASVEIQKSSFDLDDQPISFALAPDGKWLAVNHVSGGTTLIRVKDHKLIKLFRGASTSFSSDGKTMATGAIGEGGDVESKPEERAIWVWGTGSLSLKHRFQLSAYDLGAMAFQRDNRQILSLTGIFAAKPDIDGGHPELDNEIVWRHVKTGQITKRIHLHQTALRKSVFSPSGRWLASSFFPKPYNGSSQMALSIWSSSSGKRVYTSAPFPSFINDIAFSNHEKTLAVAISKSVHFLAIGK